MTIGSEDWKFTSCNLILTLKKELYKQINYLIDKNGDRPVDV